MAGNDRRFKEIAMAEQVDFIANGQAHGPAAARLLQTNFDTDCLRPYVAEDGNSYVNNQVGSNDPEAIRINATATLLRLEWTLLDTTVIRAALPRLRAVADLRGRGLQMVIPNGMSKSVLQYQRASDVRQASISMDGLSESRGDRPVYDLNSLPLPIIHYDFSFSAREIATSRAGNMPLDLTMAELAARKVAEGAEQLLLGVSSSYSYGGGSIYGYTNFPGRITTSLSDPTASAWVARLTLLDVLRMRSLSQLNLHYGPWVLYVSLSWDRYLDDDLSIYKGDLTLRDRLKRIAGIDDVVTLDYLNGYDMVLVQMSTDVAREVVGMDITTVQWETQGGMQLNFKVMCILVPQVRADINGNTGIVHGSVAGQTTAPNGAIYLTTGIP
jgi:uncharacterized linocin/CFP29 family protein